MHAYIYIYSYIYIYTYGIYGIVCMIIYDNTNATATYLTATNNTYTSDLRSTNEQMSSSPDFYTHDV